MSRPLDETTAHPSSAGGERQAWIEVAKGLGILCVVWYHVVGSYRLRGAPTWLLDLNTNWDVRLRNAMPIFFFVSGLLAARTLRRAPGPFARYLVERLLYPYVLWSVASVVLSVYVAGGSANRTLDLADLLLIGWRPLLQFWYLLALTVFLVVARVVIRYDAAMRPLIALVLLSWAGLAAGVGVEGHFSRMLEQHLSFFCIGLLAGPAVVIVVERQRSSTLLNAGLVGLALIAVTILPGMPWPDSALLPAFAGYLVLATCLPLAVLIARWRRGSWLEYVGTHSLEIYVAHVIAAGAARVALYEVGVREVVVHLPAGMLAGTAGPLALEALVRRYRLPSPFRLSWPPSRPTARPAG